jgi:hypothetical protein
MNLDIVYNLEAEVRCAFKQLCLSAWSRLTRQVGLHLLEKVVALQQADIFWYILTTKHHKYHFFAQNIVTF